MITHILYQLMGKFGVGSLGFRKVLSVIISLLVFGLMFAVVRFTGMNIPNFTRNLVTLAAIDLAGFGFLMWKSKSDVKEEKEDDKKEEVKKEPIVEREEHNDNEENNVEFVESKEDVRGDKEDEDLERVMNEIIEENKEKVEQMEKEMSAV